MKIAVEVAIAYTIFPLAYLAGALVRSASDGLSAIALTSILLAPPVLVLVLAAMVSGESEEAMKRRLEERFRRRRETEKQKRAAKRARRPDHDRHQEERFRDYAAQFGVEYPGGQK